MRGATDRLDQFLDKVASVLGHKDREIPCRDYCLGLLLDGDRKSMEPMAARLAPGSTGARHQQLQNFVTNSRWSDEAVLAAVREWVLPELTQAGPVEAWIVDDTGFPKKGKESVGVARQYCGQLGKQDNCQVAVSLSVANAQGSLPVAYRLYLPQDWAADVSRREKVRVPEGIGFQTKPQIALDQIRATVAAGVAPGVVLADAAYGDDTAFREGLDELQLSYAVGLRSGTTVWGPQSVLPTVPPRGARGRPSKRLRQAEPALSVKALAMSLPIPAWRMVHWGDHLELSGRFARVRVRPAHRTHLREELPEPVWLLIEWPEGKKEPDHYWLSNLPESITFRSLVRLTKLRWRIERDYQELKQEVGLSHFEGRSWRGFHHHASMSIAAYGYLMAERLRRQRRVKKNRGVLLDIPPLPADYIPRGSPRANRTAPT
jgi:SRSO17 transposase